MSCNLACEVGAHKRRLGNDADSSEVQSVSVPAGRDGRHLVMLALGVPHASITQKLETGVVQVVCPSAKTCGKLCTPGSVTLVPPVVLATAVVEESEQPNNGNVGTCARREDQRITFDPPPMIRAMNGATRQVVFASH